MFKKPDILILNTIFKTYCVPDDMYKKKLFLSVYIFSLFIFLCLHVDSTAVCPVCICAGMLDTPCGFESENHTSLW